MQYPIEVYLLFKNNLFRNRRYAKQNKQKHGTKRKV